MSDASLWDSERGSVGLPDGLIKKARLWLAVSLRVLFRQSQTFSLALEREWMPSQFLRQPSTRPPDTSRAKSSRKQSILSHNMNFRERGD